MIMSRVGDIVIGTCISPTGPIPAVGIISSGSPKVLEGGLPIARIGDIVMFPCGSSVIVTGSPNFLESGLPVARIGDSVQGPGIGIISSGSPRWMET